MNEEIIGKAAKIIAEDRFCTLALIDTDDYPTASAITVSQNDGIRWLTFGTGLNSLKIPRIEHSDHASVCFFSLDPFYNITLIGTIEILTDPGIKKEMWYDGLECDFIGPDDPNYCVLRFTTERFKIRINEEICIDNVA